MTPEQIFHAMYDNDPFSQSMGMELVSIGPGVCVLSMRVRADMTNGFGVAHGGVSFSLADSAFAFASNSRGQHAVSVETSINHLAPVQVDDVLTATASEDHLGRSLGLYRIEVHNQNQKFLTVSAMLL